MIPMQLNIDKISFLVGNVDVIENMKFQKINKMFDDKVMDFFSALSRKLLADKKAKTYQDIVSYAFWIRKQSLLKVKETYENVDKRMGRGITFHIAPSNVPINFAVSFTSALLAGNMCIVRVSNKEYEQVELIVKAINELLSGECSYMSSYLCLVQYEHNDDVTQYFSSMCDIRIVWGGNQTIDKIRMAKLPPRSYEMCFSDRHSLAFINADEYLQMDKEQIAKKFYTDTYYTDQNACSSPRLIAWFGERVEEARKQFWEEIEKKVKEEYEFQPILAVDKLSELCMLASEHTRIHKVDDNNVVMRVLVEDINDDIMNYKNGGGYFFEYIAKDMLSLKPLFAKECQTISYLGMDSKQIFDAIQEMGVRGVDRIVPVGNTMELSFKWDGYDMIENMSRYVYCD